MFSRSGKQTIAESLVFQNPDTHQVVSTFEKDRQKSLVKNDDKDEAKRLDFSDLKPGHFKANMDSYRAKFGKDKDRMAQTMQNPVDAKK